MQGASVRLLGCSLSFLLLFSAAGCRSTGFRHVAVPGDMVMPEAGMAGEGGPSQFEDGTRVAETGNVEQTTNATDRLITYDATLHVVVPDVANPQRASHRRRAAQEPG